MSGRRTYNRGTTYLVVTALVLTLGCAGRPPRTEETAPEPVEEADVVRNFDPLELPQDTLPVSALLGTSGSADGGLVKPTTIFPGGAFERDRSRADSLGQQVFRVQLLMAETYGEARHALAVAQEIFDQPVSLVYEVPYYKLRVGEFATRREAEDYQQQARLAGYPNAWVMLSAANIRQIQPMYDLPDSAAADTTRHEQ